MSEILPWDVHSNEERTPDGLITFIVFCEDGVCEPLYLKSLAVGNVKINVIDNSREGDTQVSKALKHCLRDGNAKWIEGQYKLLEDVKDLVWCVYDRDLKSESTEKILMEDCISFDHSIINAERVGLKVAWSNDCFELWILLHFEDVPLEPFHRSYIYERLTEICKTLPDKQPFLDKVTANARFNYKDSLKQSKKFSYILSYLKGSREKAMERAIALVQHHGGKPYHQRNPCTHIHYLVKAIVDASKGKPSDTYK